MFYAKVGRSSFLRGASRKASIAHLCTPPRALYHLPPPPTMSALASRTVPGKPSPPRQVCIVAVLSSRRVFCKKNGWIWLIFRGEKAFSASVIGGAWCRLVLSCSYDCNHGSLSLPRALFIVLLLLISFHNKNGRVCCIFHWEKSFWSSILLAPMLPCKKFGARCCHVTNLSRGAPYSATSMLLGNDNWRMFPLIQQPLSAVHFCACTSFWSFVFDFDIDIVPSFEFRLSLCWCRQWNVWLLSCCLHVVSCSFLLSLRRWITLSLTAIS